MKMEYGGTGKKRSLLEVYRPGEMNDKTRNMLELFLFPKNEFIDEQKRRTEIQISQHYDTQATIYVYFSDDSRKQILATCRSIQKKQPSEFLPIEHSTIVSQFDNTLCPVAFIPGTRFSINNFSSIFPSCEIAGLRVTNDNLYSIREKYDAIRNVFYACEKDCIANKIVAGFCTCLGTPRLNRLYKGKFHFDDLCIIAYGNTHWHALWRYPFCSKNSMYVAGFFS